ncbi:preprotein translocase subunit SecE [Candidatus Peregrinibacteria bacterium]|nr:MAG: preprotein translocase subunit SecE [Candidatus Peregrinibacteria bacterium]
MNSVKKYLQEAIHELRQVQWPTKNHAMRISIVAAIFVGSSAIIIGLVDLVLSKVILSL